MIKAASIVIGAALAATSGALSGTVRQTVAGNQFDVPKDHLFDARIAWLPASGSDSFVFLLKPNPEPGQIPEHRILVEPLAGRCPGGVSHLMDVVCGKAKELAGPNPKFERRENGLRAWASDLFIVFTEDRTGQAKRQQVASCQRFEPNPVKPKASSLCTTVWAYKNMLLQFSFDETEADKMPRMKAEAMAPARSVGGALTVGRGRRRVDPCGGSVELSRAASG